MEMECILPPATVAASNRVTGKPLAAKWRAAINPDAPAPMIKILDDILKHLLLNRLWKDATISPHQILPT
jgi:hypothetical protein